MNYLKIKQNETEVKYLDLYNESENILFGTFPNLQIIGQIYLSFRVIWCF